MLGVFLVSVYLLNVINKVNYCTCAVVLHKYM